MSKIIKPLFWTLFVLSIISVIAWSYVRISSGLDVEYNCKAYLERSANSSTIEMAKTELDTAIKYLDENNLTKGQVSIFFKNPQNDITFWYGNLTAASKELASVKPEATQLERTNILMKLRETLMDSSDSRTYVTSPDGLSIYPHNKLFLAWIIISVLAAFTCPFIAVSTDL